MSEETTNTSGQNASHDNLIREIIVMEEEMFTAVNSSNPDAKSTCQEQLKTFELMRWMTHSVHSGEYLACYLQDLKAAVEADRNMMTEKYAIMQGLIPMVLNDGILFIVTTEWAWLEDLKKEYPNIFANQQQSIFKAYLQGELQTLSDECLDLYAKDVQEGLDSGKNLIKGRYENLYGRLGYKSLEEVEAKAKTAAA